MRTTIQSTIGRLPDRAPSANVLDAVVSYQDDGMGNFVAQTPGVLNSLVKDVGNTLWKESTTDTRELSPQIFADVTDEMRNTHPGVSESDETRTAQDREH